MISKSETGCSASREMTFRFRRYLSGARGRQAPVPSEQGREVPADTLWAREGCLAPCGQTGEQAAPYSGPCGVAALPASCLTSWRHSSLTPFRVSFHLASNYAQAEVRRCRWQPQE